MKYINLAKQKDYYKVKHRWFSASAEISSGVFNIVILEADTPNLNDIIYPKELVDDCINQGKPLAVTLDEDENSTNAPEPIKVAGVIERFKWEDNLLIGEVKLTDTTSGKLCLSLLTSGVKFFPSLHSIAKCNDLGTTISDIDDFIKVRLIQLKEEGI